MMGERCGIANFILAIIWTLPFWMKEEVEEEEEGEVMVGG